MSGWLRLLGLFHSFKVDWKHLRFFSKSFEGRLISRGVKKLEFIVQPREHSLYVHRITRSCVLLNGSFT